ncbi:MAG TPA: substrate-binding domain-containing protein [Campylobacterales bacterium]|nr:substrate-binding domain-containing protein [Campylobacterales bacterium]
MLTRAKVLGLIFGAVLLAVSIGMFALGGGKDLALAQYTESENIQSATKINTKNKKIAYLVSDTRIPFWSIMEKGIRSVAMQNGYTLNVYTADNDPKKELEYAAKAIREGVAGIIISPTTSSACVTILKLAKSADIPVVISDIGTDSGDYVSYISSDNRDGAYKIGKALAKKLKKLCPFHKL